VSLKDELLSASYKGVSFLVNTSSTTGGRKTVTNEFPSSDVRFVEDLGLLNKTFSISATITGPNYSQKRNALIRALETKGPGILIHPFLGIHRVVAKPYTLDENMTSVGEANFNLVFEAAQDPILPRPVSGSLSSIFSSVNQAINLVKTSVIQAMAITDADNFLDALSKTNDFLGTVGFLTNEFVSDSESFDTFSKTLNNFTANASTILTDTVVLSDNISDVFTQLDDSIPSASDSTKLFSNLFTFGNDDTTTTGNTFQNNEKETNRNILNGSIQTMALLISYKNAVQVEYQTVAQIDKQREALDIQFDNVLSNSAINRSDKTSLYNARNQARQYFDKEALRAYKVIDFETNTTTITELNYRLYGNLDNVDTLINLNGFKDLQSIEGNIKILAR